VNVTLRSQIRQHSKLRLLRHCMAIKEGRVPPGTALDMSEQTVKPLLALWVTEWVNDPPRKSWVEDSWRKVLELAPEITSVDDVPPPAPVIYLPPPPTQHTLQSGHGTNEKEGNAHVDPETLVDRVVEREQKKWKPKANRKRSRQSKLKAIASSSAPATTPSSSSSSSSSSSTSSGSSSGASNSVGDCNPNPKPNSDSNSGGDDDDTDTSDDDDSTTDDSDSEEDPPAKKSKKVAALQPGPDVLAFLESLGYKHWQQPALSQWLSSR